MLVPTRDHDGLVDHLAKDESVEPAARDAWNILSQTLADRAWVWATLASRACRAAQQILRSRLTTYAIAAISLLLLALIALIAPLFARGWIMALVTIALTRVGVEVVRTITQQEELEPT